MIRDPFNIHRKTFLEATASATRAAERLTSTAVQAGTDVLDSMAFKVPQHVPNFNDPTRELEDRLWAARSRRGVVDQVTDKVNSMFAEDSLPMYKDKPYGYGPSGRRRSLWRKKRTFALLALFFILLGYFRGWFSKETHTNAPSWSWLGPSGNKANWDERRQHVKEAFEKSWDAYEKHAWGYDEFHPVAKTGKMMANKGLGWIIIDSLDTMILMNETTRLQHARQWLSETLTWEQDQDVSTFETTIRMMGGLLAAHYLSNEYPDLAPLVDDDEGAPGEDLYLEKAKDLGDRLLSAFESESGVPYSSVNLKLMKGIPSHADMGAASTAEATGVQLEFKYLAKLTGEKDYWDRVEKVMEIVDENDFGDGLVPIYIYPTNGDFRGNNVRLGSRGDSYYEYLIKQYLQTNKQETVYRDMWHESLAGVRKHLITYTEPSGYTIIGERPNGLDKDMSPKMDHLVCFMPGTIALAVTEGLLLAEARKLPSWSQQKEDDLKLAEELMQTCWGMYKYMKTGLAAEITYFKISDPPAPESAHHDPPAEFDDDPHAPWREDFSVHSQDQHNLQRPETVESLFYMWRITGDIKYREWGWEMFKSFIKYTSVDEEDGGFTSLLNANVIPPIIKDNMESFWLVSIFFLLISPVFLIFPDILTMPSYRLRLSSTFISYSRPMTSCHLRRWC